MPSHPALYPHVVNWLTQHVLKRRPVRVLEQGAGGGQYAKLFASDVYISIDIPETWYAAERLPSVYAQAHTLPFRDGSFSLVFNVAAFDYFGHPERVLIETSRVLIPGGSCFIFTYDRPTLERIHENCRRLPQSRAVLGHHVDSADELARMADGAGLDLRELPFDPNASLIDRLKLWVRPTNHRVYRLDRRN